MDCITSRTKWDPRVLREDWIHHSGDKVMIRLKSWELSYAAVYAAVAPHFPNGDFEISVMKFHPPFGGYSFVMTSSANLDILRNAKFVVVPSGAGEESTALRKVPKYKLQRTEHANILTAKIPSWIKPSELHALFSRFNSTPSDDYPGIMVDNYNNVRITFSDLPAHIDDGIIARAITSHHVFTNHETGETANVKFSHLIDDIEDFQTEKQRRRDKYLELLRVNDMEKYERELEARKSRYTSRCAV